MLHFPLCFRCEHRALYLESRGKRRPRYECGARDRAVVGCYMYQPCKPVAIGKDERDPRPLAPGYFSARFHGVALAECEARAARLATGYVVFYWVPKKARFPKQEKRGKEENGGGR